MLQLTHKIISGRTTISHKRDNSAEVSVLLRRLQFDV